MALALFSCLLLILLLVSTAAYADSNEEKVLLPDWRPLALVPTYAGEEGAVAADKSEPHLYRQIRDVFGGSGSGGDLTKNCSVSSTSVTPFTSIALTLDSLLAECITQLSSSDVYNYSLTVTSPNNFTFDTHTGHSSLLFADKFDIGKTYSLSVAANCSVGSICEYPSVTLLLPSLKVLNHSDRLLPFGGDNGLADKELVGVDDDSATVVVDGNKPIPVFDRRYRKIYISSNGLVSLTRPYNNWQPIPFPYGQVQLPLLAPFWTDLDLRTSSGHLYYHVYESTDGLRARNILKIASDRIRNLTGEVFDGRWVLIATWSNVVPYLGANHENETITFQLVLVSNYTSTFSLYLYNHSSISPADDSSSQLPLVVGYSTADYVNYYNANVTATTVHTAAGNTGTVGQWAFDVSPALTDTELIEEKCLQWAALQESISLDWINDLPVCPCSLLQAQSDWRFSFASSSSQNCALAVATLSQHGLECCYGDNGSLTVGTENGGSYHYRHSLFRPTEHMVNDSIPFSQCCQETDNCELYYRYRPSSNCTGYQPPSPGFLWGDPHFETHDGTNYTFNGVGEYQLILSTANNLNVQVRLSDLPDTTATVLTAVAIKSRNSQLVQLEINSLGLYVLYIGDMEYPNLPDRDEYLVITDTATHGNGDLASVDPAHLDNVFVLNRNGEMVVATPTGAVLTIGKESTFLYVSAELGPVFLNSTNGGLMGYYDGDRSNDFLLPNGTVLSADLTEEEVFHQFGLAWHVSEAQSIFHYHTQYSYSDHNSLTDNFVPSFGLSLLEANSSLYDSAVASCEGDYSCLYDTGQTGDLILGLATHNIRLTNRKIHGQLGNFPPVINGSRQIIVTVGGASVVSRYSAEDPDDETATILKLKSPVPDGIQLNSSGYLELNLTSLPTSPLYITSSDSTNATTVQRISILLCNCRNNGTCISNATSYPLNNHGHHRLLCQCPIGFAGDYCQIDMRVCGHDPCPTYSKCRDSSGSDYSTCVNCTNGYITNSDMKCTDVDECVSDTHNCSQVCINTDGGFQCSCNDGYRLEDDGVTCTDIDECLENTDNCEHLCTNTAGSYECTCLLGWNSNGNLCVPSQPCHNGLFLCAFLSNANGCAYDGGWHCSCQKGYSFNSSSCEACQYNQYGFDCDRNCSCQNESGVCDSVNGCVCTAGWTGHDCATEINENSPSFSANTPSTLSLPRLLPQDTPLLFLSASDPDTGRTGQVTYRLVQSPHPLPPNTSDGIAIFSINSTTGLLSTERDLHSLPYSFYILHVQARDEGSAPQSSIHLLVINVTNEPLPSPKLTSPTATLTIEENKAADTAIFNVNCTEINSINANFTELTLSITSGNTNDTFRLYGTQLLTNRRIDYEQFEVFRLTFSCTNAFNITDVAMETIVVINLNDNPFKFVSISHSIQLYENTTNGHLVTTVQAADADVSDAIIRYSLTDSNQFGDVFAVNSSTGQVIVESIILQMPFDRERRDNYTFNVTADLYDNNGVSIVESVQTAINISILDINDYTPLFSQSLYLSNNLSQMNSFPDTVTFVSAIDKDLGVNSQIVYSLEANPHFDINSMTGEIYVKTANISKGNYLLRLNATDGGTPPLTGTSVVDIFVRATPEELLFTRRTYSFSFSENVGPGSTVGVVKAVLYDIFNVSIDEGSASEAIEYRITGGSDVSAFTVTSSGGHLITNKLLDYENESVYHLDVTAILADFPGVTVATTRVQLTLVDVNDNSPVFQPSSYAGLLYEDESVGTTVLTVYATDLDQNGLQSITYSLPEDFNGPFRIDEITGAITVSRELISSDYHFQVIASDSGPPILSSIATVYISVTRRLTVEPVLNSTFYIFSIPESFHGSHVIGNIGAITEGNRSVVSQDDGVGFRLRQPGYQPPVATPFSVNSTTGAVTVTPSTYPFNYEERREYLFYVELYDIFDTDIIFDVSPVLVKITDVNDNIPVFAQSSYRAVIPQNTLAHEAILTVQATDRDSSSNAQLVYTLSSSMLGFHIDRTSGVVSVTNSTLRSGDYHMTVTVSDRGNPAQSSAVNVSVIVLPAPSVFIIFSQTIYTFEVMENSAISTHVGQVAVTSLVNQTYGVDNITYSLIGAPHSCFTIDAETGTVTLSCADLDREEQSHYDLVARATGLNGLSADVKVRVNVGDRNDQAPLFDQQTYTKVIYTDHNDTRELIQPLVSDKDIGNNAVAVFDIAPLITDLISIDRSTGLISLAVLNGSLPEGDYRFTISASDSLNSSLRDTAVFLLTIVTPQPQILSFSPSSLIFSVPENSPPGTIVGNLQLLTPRPLDPGDFLGNLNFEILSGNGADYFHVMDSNATMFLVNDLLDRETVDTHVLLIKASLQDFGVSTTAYVTVRVSDENDNAPTFNQSLYVVTLNSSAPANTHLVTVKANDRDLGLNKLIAYSFANATSYFHITSDTGAVSTLTSPIPEAHYKLIAVAVDSGQPRLSSTSVISVTAEVPLPETISFVESSYTFHITENSPAGTFVGTVAISQQSSALDSLLYSFVTPSNAYLATNLNSFYLDPLLGNMSTLASIDRETFSGGTVDIKAHLPSTPSLSTTVPVTLIIDDENDNRPIFTTGLYTASITEGSISTGSTILTATATDSDSGTNKDITYQITGNTFNIHSTSGDIRASNTGLTSGVYTATVTARDAGDPQLTGTAQLIITVYAPIPSGIGFTEISYTKYLNEDTPVGSNCGTVRLNTIDTSYVTSIQYAVSSSNFVAIANNLQATIYNTIAFDFETTTRYDFVVNATVYLTGASVASATASTSYTVRLRDVNDNAPVFQNLPGVGHYSASVNENTGSGTSIFTVSVTDVDSGGSNGDITFSLENSFSNHFQIDSDGTIRTGSNLIDRETNTHFVLVVVATDGGSPSLSSTAQLIVTVGDLNDNSPQLISNNGFNYNFAEEQKPNVVLFTVIANDLDSSSQLTFAITGGTGSGKFVINSAGQVMSTEQLDSDQGPSDYSLIVQVSDGSNSDSATLHLHLINVPRDSRPVFVNFPLSLRVSPFTPTGTVITTFAARDSDGDGLSYQVTPNNLFNIDSQTGALQKVSQNDLTPGAAIPLTIIVTDNSSYTLSNSSICTVDVLKELSFLNSSYSLTVNESASENTIIGDLAIAQSSLFSSYSFGQEQEYFQLLPQIGGVNVQLSQMLDYEMPEQRSFSFAVHAQLEGYVSSSTLVTVQVLDINDNSPVFIGTDSFTAQDSELIIGTVEATDADSGSNGAITFSIDGTSTLFTISPSSGELRKAALLDPGVETVTVLAVDGGSPQRSTSRVYTVHISAASSGGSVIPYVLVGIVTVLLVIAVVGVCVLSVLLVKRRERVKKKNRDPYLDMDTNDNWKLMPANKNKKPEGFEMKRKGSQGEDTSAYETMYEEDLVDMQRMPWSNPSYKDKEQEDIEAPTDEASSEITTSISTDLHQSLESTLADRRRLSKVGSQKGTPQGPISRRGRRASGEGSNSDLDTEEYLREYQESTALKPGERPPEYGLLLASDGKAPPGTRPSLRNVLWPQGLAGGSQPFNLAKIERQTSSTKL